MIINFLNLISDCYTYLINLSKYLNKDNQLICKLVSPVLEVGNILYLVFVSLGLILILDPILLVLYFYFYMCPL